MVDGMQHRRGGTTGHTQIDGRGRRWLWSLALVMLLMSTGRLPRGTEAAERARPVRIGALTDSWGSTPHMAGLRDGLVALGYREREDTEAQVQEMLAQVWEHKIDGIVQPSSVSLNIPGFIVEAAAQRAIPTM